MEIERKFLLDNSCILSTLLAHGVKLFKHNIKQFYTHISPKDEIRYRSCDESYTLTRKSGVGLIRDELEVNISKSEFKKASKKRVSSLIKKTRYDFSLDGHDFSLDMYGADVGFIAVLEIEFKSVDEADGFKLPSVFDDVTLVEITNDARYKNKFLSLLGDPKSGFDTKKCLQILNSLPNLKPVFPPYIPAYEALIALFTQIYHGVKLSFERYKQQHCSDALHDFRVGLRKTRSLLKLCRDVFDEQSLNLLLDGFKKISDKTNEKRDLDVILDHFDEAMIDNELSKNLKIISQNQATSISEYLNTSEVNRVFMDYEAFLASSFDFYAGAQAKSALKPYIAGVIREGLIRFEKKFSRLKDDSLNEDFHKVRIELKRLRYLVENFFTLFDLDKFGKFILDLKAMQELFGKLQDRDVWCEILGVYGDMDGDIGKFAATQEDGIKREILKLRDKIIRKKSSFSKKSKKYLRALNAQYN